MTATQMIEIPASRRIHLDFEVSRELPEGKALVSVTPLAEASKRDISLLSLRGSCKGLDTAALTDDVIINNNDGKSYKILPIVNDGKKGKSPFENIPQIKLDITTQEIVELIRESRAGI